MREGNHDVAEKGGEEVAEDRAEEGREVGEEHAAPRRRGGAKRAVEICNLPL